MDLDSLDFTGWARGKLELGLNTTLRGYLIYIYTYMFIGA